MFPGLNSLVEISETKPPKGKFILLSDQQTDGSFLVHHFISLYIKGGFQICFVALAQSFAHYSSVLHKLGVNINIACENGQMTYIDGLKLISEGLSVDQHDKTNDHENPFLNIRDPKFSLEKLYHQVKSSVQKTNSPCLLLVDDLSVLNLLGVAVQKINDFSQYCTDLMCHRQNVVDGCFVCLVHCDNDVDDDDSLLLWKQLCHVAHMEMHVEGLSSGYCKDVHGQLVITWREPHNTRPKSHIKKISQYKIQDRMVTFFAPGTSKAVL